jgi:redox-sensitive bicupin YhaK (pirin superfamily)
MITLRPSAARGHIDYGWLDTRHTFSFGNYYDEAHMGYHALRVINDDVVAGKKGFGKHFHDDMEILTYVLSGRLTHEDNAGGGGSLGAGDVQRMSAGTGVIHSEWNHGDEAVRLLQIWIIPREFGVTPTYEQKHFPDEGKRGKLLLLASGDGRDGSLRMVQDADTYASILDAGAKLEPRLANGRHVWLHVIRGRLEANGAALGPGDGAAFEDEPSLSLRATEETEFLLFDLP